MASPFPGMDPFLESPSWWPTVHLMLIAVLAEEINALLPREYWVAIDRHSFVIENGSSESVGRPDVLVGVSEGRSKYRVSTPTLEPLQVRLPVLSSENPAYLTIKETNTKNVVTVIEVLSPANKLKGQGREPYLEKRDAVLKSASNLVEIDLLRAGPKLPYAGAPAHCDYSVLVSRSIERPKADMYCWQITDSLPTIPVPLKQGDPEVMVGLSSALNKTYDRGGFNRWIRYDQEVPPPPLSAVDQEWVEATLRDHGLR